MKKIKGDNIKGLEQKIKQLAKEKKENIFLIKIKIIKLTPQNISLLSKKYKFKYEVNNDIYEIIWNQEKIVVDQIYLNKIYLIILNNKLVDII